MSKQNNPKRQFSSGNEELIKDLKQPPLPAYVSGESDKLKQKENSDQKLSQDIDKMMQQFAAAQDEIEQKLDQIYQLSGWTPEMIKNHLSNPNNFDQATWAFIEKERESLNQMFNPGKKQKIGGDKSPSQVSSEPNIPKSARERRNKSIGVRRNWIPL
jgi:hypothetical protein